MQSEVAWNTLPEASNFREAETLCLAEEPWKQEHTRMPWTQHTKRTKLEANVFRVLSLVGLVTKVIFCATRISQTETWADHWYLVAQGTFASTVQALFVSDLNGELIDKYGVTLCLWYPDYKVLSFIAPRFEDTEFLHHAIMKLVPVLFLFSQVLRTSKRAHGIAVGIQLLGAFISTPLAPVQSTFCMVTRWVIPPLKRFFYLGHRRRSDAIFSTWKVEGVGYFVRYQVATWFYWAFSTFPILAVVNMEASNLMRTSIALLLVLTPHIIALIFGAQWASFVNAINGSVEVKTVDQLLEYTATKRQELLKVLLKRGRLEHFSHERLHFALKDLYGNLELKKEYTASELRKLGVKICEHVIVYENGERFKVSKSDYQQFCVHRNVPPEVPDSHRVGSCFLSEGEDPAVI